MHFAYRKLRCAHGEWCVRGDLLRQRTHVALEIGLGYYPVDETDTRGLGGVDVTGGEQQVTGMGGPDEVVEAVDGRDRVRDPETRDRDAVHRVVRADAHVGAHRHDDTATHAEPVDHRDDRFGKFAQFAHAESLVVRAYADPHWLIAELADVCSRGE